MAELGFHDFFSNWSIMVLSVKSNNQLHIINQFDYFYSR
jgi:hypothetical protein